MVTAAISAVAQDVLQFEEILKLRKLQGERQNGVLQLPSLLTLVRVV